MIIQKYCSERLKTRYITARTIIREKKLKRLAQKSKSVDNHSQGESK